MFGQVQVMIDKGLLTQDEAGQFVLVEDEAERESLASAISQSKAPVEQIQPGGRRQAQQWGSGGDVDKDFEDEVDMDPE